MDPYNELKCRMAEDKQTFAELATPSEFYDMRLTVGMMMTGYLMAERGMDAFTDILEMLIKRTRFFDYSKRIMGEHESRRQARNKARQTAKGTLAPFRQEEAAAMLKDITEESQKLMDKCKQFTQYMEHGSRWLMKAGTKSSIENYDGSMMLANDMCKVMAVASCVEPKDWPEFYADLKKKYYDPKKLSKDMYNRFSNDNY